MRRDGKGIVVVLLCHPHNGYDRDDIAPSVYKGVRGTRLIKKNDFEPCFE